MSNFEFIAFQPESLLAMTTLREGEVKLGQVVSSAITSKTRFVLIGICEDIGPQANLGNAGSKNGFMPAVHKLLNMQSNRKYHGEDLCVAGYIKQNCAFTTVENGRKLVEELDQLVQKIVQPFMELNFIPLVIGGGHNNAFPLIKSFAKAKNNTLEVINLDPHADCRRLEGRHSGNPFSYAREEGLLSNYTVLGLHAAYNSESILHYLNEHEFYYSYFEEYIIRPEKLELDIQIAIIRSDDPLGIELDLDSIKFMPTSAYTPSGLSIEQARYYVMKLASSKRRPAYLHLPEASLKNDQEEKIVSKSIAYLIHDFISSCKHS